MNWLVPVVGGAAVGLGFITAVLGLINQRHGRATAAKVQSISVNVDGRLSEFIARQAQLIEALQQSGVPVPPVPPRPIPEIPA